MPQIPFVGETYPSRSTNINAARAINFYPEVNKEDSKSVVSLIGTPGTSLYISSGSSTIRGMRPFNGLLYFVSGTYLYSVNPALQISTVLGNLATSTGFVCMKDNGITPTGGNQLIITDGVHGYIYNVNTSTFSTISSAGFPSGGATSVTYLDGYFIVNNASPSISFYVSNLYDGTTWGSLATAAASASSDPIQIVWAIHQQLALIKQYSTEFFYDSGTPTTSGSPFLRISGSVIDYGTPAPWSVAQGDNTIYFLAQQRMGDVGEFIGVVGLNGYTPEVISPPSINYQISQMKSISDAFAYFYSAEGHTFYVLTFPSGNATFVYDTTTHMWHERSTYAGSQNSINRHIGNCYAYYNGKHLIGDYQNGNIYTMDSSIFTDNGQPIVSIRTAQHITDKKDFNNIFIHRLWVDVESGTYPSGGYAPQGQLSWSNDGGHVFGNDYDASMGNIGQYKTRLLWRRLGVARDRVWKLSMSDPCRKVILGAGMESTGGVS